MLDHEATVVPIFWMACFGCSVFIGRCSCYVYHSNVVPFSMSFSKIKSVYDP